MPTHEFNEKSERDEGIERRMNLEVPANVKPREPNHPFFLIFAEEQSGDQETAQNEEQVHAHPTGP